MPEPEKKALIIKSLSPDEKLSLMRHYTKEGFDPPLSFLLSALMPPVRLSEDEENSKLPSSERLNLAHRFFGQARVHRILQAVKDGQANATIRNELQRHLNLLFPGGQLALWRYHAGWLKYRILCSFDPECFGENFELRFQSERFGLDELLKLPLRDPYGER